MSINCYKLVLHDHCKIAVKDNQMPQLRISFFLLLMALATFGQSQQTLSGWVLDEKEKKVLKDVHVINKTSLKGTMSDDRGFFEIKLNFGDTVVFSNIAYQYYNFIYNDSSTALSEVIIEMKEQNYLLSEVQVTTYKLTSNKPREMILNKPSVPDSRELRSDVDILANELQAGGWLYEMLSSKAHQLAKLRQLQIEDAYRKRLEQSNNRESVIKLTGLNMEELESFLFYCKFAPINMYSMNDYQFLLNVQRCFRAYVHEKELEGFLQQFD